MEEKVTVVFSWDPRARIWVKERGPEDSATPPVPPIDDRAVQTYYLDPSNGRWGPTILGPRARQIAAELKDAYRAAAVTGLALPGTATPGELRHERRGWRVPVLASLSLVILAAIVGTLFAAPTFFTAGAPRAVERSASPSMAANTPTATPQPASATATIAALPRTVAPATAAPTTRPAATPPNVLSVSISGGAMVYYNGPLLVTQGAPFQATFLVILPTGARGSDPLTVYLGNPSDPNARSVVQAGRPDPNGNYIVTVVAAVPKGDQLFSVSLGSTGGLHALGSLAVR